MASTLMLRVCVETNQQHLKLEDIDLDSNVNKLKEKTSNAIQKDGKEFDLIYAGVILDSDATVSSYGIKNGFTIYVLPKPKSDESEFSPMPSDTVLATLAKGFKSFGYRLALQRLSKPEVLAVILNAAPNLVNDPGALAIIQDAELMSAFVTPESIRKLLELHPVLIDAIHTILSEVKEESFHPSTQTATAGSLAYSLDALSTDDDDDMDDNVPTANPLQRNASYNAITAAQLAAAIANATTNFTSSGAPIAPVNPINSMNSAASSSVITSEMFGNALQQAIATASNATNNHVTSPTQQGETLESIRTRYEPQLRQMREMGLANESQNIRALQASSGDVQAAIELVFNGVIE